MSARTDPDFKKPSTHLDSRFEEGSLLSEVGKYRVVFKIQGIGEAKGELIRRKSPLTAESVWRAIPIVGKASVWRNAEIYFPAGIKRGLERATKAVEVGDIAHWPLGDAICVFYDNVEPYSDVNIIGKILEGLSIFSKIKLGTTITLDRLA